MPRRSDTVVIQSHRLPLPFDWLELCLESVRQWAASRGYDYRFEDDAIFERLDDDLWQWTKDQLVITSDLARLAALQAALDKGYDCAVWLDADMLVFEPDRLHLARDDCALGQEVLDWRMFCFIGHAKGEADEESKGNSKIQKSKLLSWILAVVNMPGAGSS